MPAYTRNGDDGLTSLFGGRRLAKSSLRISAIGEVDELNACIGFARSLNGKYSKDSALEKIQRLLFAAGADLATPVDVPSKTKRIGAEETAWLEKEADEIHNQLKPLKNFILPGGSQRAAALHYARTVCRRAERAIVLLSEKESCNKALLPFFNRLSSLLFVLARLANKGEKEEEWRP